MRWSVRFSERFEDQISSIVQYIAENSGSVEVAMAYYGRVKRAIQLLEEQPFLGRQPRDATIRRQGYRVLIIERQLIFYRADEVKNEIAVVAIVDMRTDYKELV